jgi:hypothetical protein
MRSRPRLPLETFTAHGSKPSGPKPPGEDEFRWQLEEFRVSLFAQQRDARPVSAASCGCLG